MGRVRSIKLTVRESALMEALWTLGEATAEEIRASLRGPDVPHDSTVRTLLRVLEHKGHVTHAQRGKAFVYRPLVPRGQAQKTALRDVLSRFFGGSAEDLVLRLIEDEQLTVEELDAIRRSANSKKPKKGKRP
jgi:predicted transcriptional regulator